MSRYLVDRIEASDAIAVRTRTAVGRVDGAQRLERVHLAGLDGGEEALDAAGMFVFIGARPRTGWLDGSPASSQSATCGRRR